MKSGQLFVDQVRSSTRTTFVSVLLHGFPGTGKTALAATIAASSQFPFIKLVSPDSMVGYSEQQKVAAITKIFNDSYKSPLSVIVMDSIERLIGEHGCFTLRPWLMGDRMDADGLQVLERDPTNTNGADGTQTTKGTLDHQVGMHYIDMNPQGRRLLILATTSVQSIMSDIGFSDVFDSELRVPPITSLKALEYIIHQVELFERREDRKAAMRMLEEAGFSGRGVDGLPGSTKLQIGIKRLLGVIEMARQEPENAGQRLVSSLLGLGM